MYVDGMKTGRKNARFGQGSVQEAVQVEKENEFAYERAYVCVCVCVRVRASWSKLLMGLATSSWRGRGRLAGKQKLLLSPTLLEGSLVELN